VAWAEEVALVGHLGEGAEVEQKESQWRAKGEKRDRPAQIQALGLIQQPRSHTEHQSLTTESSRGGIFMDSCSRRKAVVPS
jgi:hypothetical protein